MTDASFRSTSHNTPDTLYRLTIYRDAIYNSAMNNTISQPEFYILLSLAIKSKHGYEIMKQVEQDSARKISLGPGTLYGAIKRMLTSDLIEEVPGDDSRRKYYTLTEKGRQLLSSELERYNDTVALAKRNNLFKQLGLLEFVVPTVA